MICGETKKPRNLPKLHCNNGKSVPGSVFFYISLFFLWNFLQHRENQASFFSNPALQCSGRSILWGNNMCSFTCSFWYFDLHIAAISPIIYKHIVKFSRDQSSQKHHRGRRVALLGPKVAIDCYDILAAHGLVPISTQRSLEVGGGGWGLEPLCLYRNIY